MTPHLNNRCGRKTQRRHRQINRDSSKHVRPHTSLSPFSRTNGGGGGGSVPRTEGRKEKLEEEERERKKAEFIRKAVEAKQRQARSRCGNFRTATRKERYPSPLLYVIRRKLRVAVGARRQHHRE